MARRCARAQPHKVGKCDFSCFPATLPRCRGFSVQEPPDFWARADKQAPLLGFRTLSSDCESERTRAQRTSGCRAEGPFWGVFDAKRPAAIVFFIRRFSKVESLACGEVAGRRSLTEHLRVLTETSTASSSNRFSNARIIVRHAWPAWLSGPVRSPESIFVFCRRRCLRSPP